MKKSLKIALIVIAVIVVVAILVVIGIFAFAKDRTPITSEEFRAKMETNGYVISDATYQFMNYDEYIEKVYIAASSGYSYQIEFYELSDEASAQNFFKVNKEEFENSKESIWSQSNFSVKNYSTYALSTSGKYKVLSRVENTVIYLNVDEEYKDEVKTVLKDLGY